MGCFQQVLYYHIHYQSLESVRLLLLLLRLALLDRQIDR